MQHEFVTTLVPCNARAHSTALWLTINFLLYFKTFHIEHGRSERIQKSWVELSKACCKVCKKGWTSAFEGSLTRIKFKCGLESGGAGVRIGRKWMHDGIGYMVLLWASRTCRPQVVLENFSNFNSIFLDPIRTTTNPTTKHIPKSTSETNTNNNDNNDNNPILVFSVWISLWSE